jgi:hypothetical protein
MPDLTETLGRAGLTLAEGLAGETDLEKVRAALIQEEVIRKVMRDTGEPRDIVVDMIDAMKSMADEAVLDLMEGEPTSLRAALQRYVDELEKRDELQPRDRVVDDLSVLLNYRFRIASGGPGQELEIREPDDDHLEVWVGGQEVSRANYDEHGRSGMAAVQATAEAIHRALVK